MTQQAQRQEPPAAPSGPAEDDPRPTGGAAPVRALTLVGLSRDRSRLVLTDTDGGAEFTLPVTPDLLAALGEVPGAPAPDGSAARRTTAGEVETKMTSSMRPREIQTRIRAGETAEAVAATAGTTVEAIMAYVGPVLAEREHVATRAQRASVRRAPGEGSGSSARVLGDAVEATLRGRGLDPAQVVWDAFRRETGRWVLTATFATDERSGEARFTYDAPGNYVLVEDDDARWLLGELVETEVIGLDDGPEAGPGAGATRDDLRQVRERRLGVVAEPDELPLGDLSPGAAETSPRQRDDELPLGGSPGSAPEVRRPVPGPPSEAAPRPAAETPHDDEPAAPRRPVQKKRGRASVPSWDEIMFGGGDQDERS